MIKIIIADDEEIFREGIKIILDREEEIEIIGEAANGEELIKICEEKSPDVVLMDIAMPGCDGIEATSILKQKFKDIKILILTTFHDEESISRAINKGADGYILKDVCSQDLIMSIKSCYKGFSIIHKNVFPSIAKCVRESGKISFLSKEKRNSIVLTQKEKELIKLIVEGSENKEIAALLFITEGTVRNSISRILKKFDLKDRIQLAVFAVKNDLA